MPDKKPVPAKTSKFTVKKKKIMPVAETAVPLADNPDPAVGPVKKRRPTLRFRRPGRKIAAVRVPANPHKLLSPYRLFIQACKIPLQHWEVFGGILLIFGLLNALLVGGLSGVNEVIEAKTTLREVFTGQFSQIWSGLTLFGFLATTQANNAASGVAGAYSSLLLLIVSLAIIWALRMVYAGNIIRIRDAFYNGMQPFIQSILVLFVVGLQTAPAAIGVQIYSMIMSNNILQGYAEVGLATFILLLLIMVSVYMLCSSLFALYIITLPNIAPLEALRSAKQIVQYRRGKVFYRLLAMVVGLVLLAALIMVPVALLLTPAAPVVFYIITVIGLVILHGYMYSLYRELIAQ